MNDKAPSPEFIASLEKLNLFYHVHELNKEMMKNIGILLEKIEAPEVEAVAVDFITQWLNAMGDRTQSVDALMHILQDSHTGEAKVWLESASDAEQIHMRDSINTPILDKMDKILNETVEERTQRILLEMLNIHD